MKNFLFVVLLVILIMVIRKIFINIKYNYYLNKYLKLYFKWVEIEDKEKSDFVKEKMEGLLDYLQNNL